MSRLVEVPLTRPDAVRLIVDLDAPPYLRGEPPYYHDLTMHFLTALVLLYQPRTVVEVGTFDGETTVALAQALPSAVVYGLDLYTEWAEPLIKTWGVQDRVRLIRGPSQDTIAQLPDGIDFAYIDGDHTFEGVKADTEKLEPKLINGAIIAFHDTNGPGVREYVLGRFRQTGVEFRLFNGLLITQKHG